MMKESMLVRERQEGSLERRMSRSERMVGAVVVVGLERGSSSSV